MNEPTEKAYIAPMPPIKLITPLALLLNFEGIMSGINATTGALYTAIATLKRVMIESKRRRSLTTGIILKKMAAIGTPKRIYGIRLPNLVQVLSDFAPIHGWRVIAAILSNIITKPMNVFSQEPNKAHQYELPSIMFLRNIGTYEL